MIKEDRRIKKTKKALAEALADLLIEKNIQKITIQELIDKADVGRRTFYDHFADISGLQSYMEDIAIDKLVLVSKITPTVKPTIFYKMLLKYLTDNPQLRHLFFTGNISQAAYHRIGNLFSESYIRAMRKTHRIPATDGELENHAFFCFSGIIALIEKYFSGKLDCSNDELILMLANMEMDWTSTIVNRFNIQA